MNRAQIFNEVIAIVENSKIISPDFQSYFRSAIEPLYKKFQSDPEYIRDLDYKKSILELMKASFDEEQKNKGIPEIVLLFSEIIFRLNVLYAHELQKNTE